jgi:hypothetical protein
VHDAGDEVDPVGSKVAIENRPSSWIGSEADTELKFHGLTKLGFDRELASGASAFPGYGFESESRAGARHVTSASSVAEVRADPRAHKGPARHHCEQMVDDIIFPDAQTVSVSAATVSHAHG